MERREGRTGGEPFFLRLLPLPLPFSFPSMVLPLFIPSDRFCPSFQMMRYLTPEISPRILLTSLLPCAVFFPSEFNELRIRGGC